MAVDVAAPVESLSKDNRRSKAYQEANKAVGFREYDLHHDAARFTHSWSGEPRFQGSAVVSVRRIIVWFGKGWNFQPSLDLDDPVVAHGLSCRVKYVRIVRRKLNGKPCFYAQLVCEGQPYQKPKNQPGQGYVGLDIGPSMVAGVGETDAFLKQFCVELASRQQPRWHDQTRQEDMAHFRASTQDTHEVA